MKEEGRRKKEEGRRGEGFEMGILNQTKNWQRIGVGIFNPYKEEVCMLKTSSFIDKTPNS
jgi:hypothetical protein